MWYVYIVRCADNTLYTGVTTDLQRRVKEHNNEQLGAKYTRAKRPVTLVYFEPGKNRSEVLKREAVIKRMSKDKKNLLIETFRFRKEYVPS